ncbi:MAG: lysozyme [Bacteroidetes bacterium]|nr:lysozyme [Bacteroidota bacterium]
MKTSSTGLNLIKTHEGLRLEAYQCPAGRWTIGYGHTRTAQAGMRITEAQAHMLLQSDLAAAEAIVNTALPGLKQHQFDALVSFVFNVGAKAFLNSTLLRKIRTAAPEADIRAEFARWIYANGKPLPGLAKRRADEANLFFNTNQA